MLLPSVRYISSMPYTISWVASVTIKGCKSNLATQKPFTAPMMAPTAITSKITTGMGSVPMPANILLE